MEFVKSRSIGKGEKLFHERDTSNEVYFLRVGTLLLLKGEILIGQIKPPAFVGEMGPILNTSRSTTVIAKSPASLDVYDGRELMVKLTVKSELGAKFLKSLSERFEMIRNRVVEYQYMILQESLKILSVLISEKRVSDKRQDFSEVKNVRRDVELLLEQTVKRVDVLEDFTALLTMARQNGVLDKYQQGMTTRFKTFLPLDMKPFKLAKADTFLDFRSAAQSTAEKIVTLTKYLAEFQKLGLGHLDSEITLIEETLPFAMREQILKELMLGVYAKGSLDDFKRHVTEFDRSVKSLAESPGHADMPLGPIARKFNLEQPYMKTLQTKWKEYLMK